MLAACGDNNANVSAAPANVYPACHWQDTRADWALEELCRLTCCSLVLDYQTNIVSVVRLGVGQGLPDNNNQTHTATYARIGAVPDAIAVGCGPTRFQSKLLLEAVGLDTDNDIKPIDSLSYRPAGGWSRSWPGVFPDVTFGKARYLASRTVWRWYRVKEQASGGFSPPGASNGVVSRTAPSIG